MKLTAKINFTGDYYFLTLDSEGYDFIKKKKISFKKLYGGLSHQSRYWTHHGGGNIIVEHSCRKQDLDKVIENVNSYGIDVEVVNKKEGTTYYSSGNKVNWEYVDIEIIK